jgi:hypothetical protein
MAKSLLFILLIFPFAAICHPGIGIVIDSRGVIYYTDLQNVWKITSGNREIALKNVHTHELYLDAFDNLFGEDLQYLGDASGKFTHLKWKLSPEGKLDTLVSIRQAYRDIDFSLATDKNGNEYYIKKNIDNPDSIHIYIKPAGGEERIFATGGFTGVKWLHPQSDGSVLYELKNKIFRVHKNGNIELLADQVGKKPTFKFSGNSITIWGLWEDNEKNVYAAVFSEQAVKKIDRKGNITIYYRSEGNYAPTHGVFDKDGNLWVLESSDKNEIRVVKADLNAPVGFQKGFESVWIVIVLVLAVVPVLIYLMGKRKPVRSAKI